MKPIGFSRVVYCPAFKFKADFYIANSHVYTVSRAKYLKLCPPSIDPPEDAEEWGINDHGCYLIVDSTFELEPYDSVIEGAAKLRPQLLVIHGLLSFFTNEVFVSYNDIHGEKRVIPGKHISPTRKKPVLSINGTIHDADLKKTLDAINHGDEEKKTLLYTLFERWRKALFLEAESIDSYIHIDEAVLAYIHVLEVLSDEFAGLLKQELRQQREKLVQEIITIAISDINNKETAVNKLIDQLKASVPGLLSKLRKMLKELNLYDLKTEMIVVRFVEHRNAIAHGRKNLYQDKVVFPLKPFFSFIKDIDENIWAIKILSAKVISAYLSLNAWNEEWEIVKLMEFTPLSLVKGFLQKKKYSSLSDQEFLEGKIDDISPATLAYYTLKDKISIADLEKASSAIILSAKLNKEPCIGLFRAAVLLSDSTDLLLATKCMKIITMVHARRWGHYSNIRDILKEHEYHQITLKRFGTWLASRSKKIKLPDRIRTGGTITTR